MLHNIQKKKNYIFIMLIVLPVGLHAAFGMRPAGAWLRSLAYAGTASSRVTFPAFNNPALLSVQQDKRILISYHNFYGIGALNQSGVSLTMPGFIPWGVDYIRMGNATYGENTLTMAAAFSVNENLSVGLAVRFYLLTIKGYGNAFTTGISAAIRSRITDDLTLAFRAVNINEPVIGQVREKLPLFGSAGINWRVDDAIHLLGDARFSTSEAWDFSWGMEFIINNHLSARAGTRQSTHTVNGGFTLSWSGFLLYYALEFHPELNYSHTLDIAYVF